MNVLLSVIDPVAISIGPIKIYWYGIIIALAMLIGISLATKEAQKLGLEEDTMVDMALWAIPIALSVPDFITFYSNGTTIYRIRVKSSQSGMVELPFMGG